MKKGFYVIIVAILLYFIIGNAFVYGESAVPVPRQIEADYELSLALPADFFVVGDEIYLQIKASKALPLYAFEFEVFYDASVLKYIGFSSEIKSDDSLVIEKHNEELDSLEASGVITLDTLAGNLKKAVILCSKQGKDTETDPGSLLATLSFECTASGKAPVLLSHATIVMENMDYSKLSPAEKILVSISPEKTYFDGGSSGGGGSSKPSRPTGGGGGMVIAGGNSTSVAAPVQEMPLPTSRPHEDTEAPAFSDITDSVWAEEAIEKLAKLEVLKGYGDGTFRPNLYVNRAEFCQMIVRAFPGETQAAAPTFKDVVPEDWFYEAVVQAASQGIVKGYEEHRFFPQQNILRQEAATVMARIAAVHELDLTPKRLNINFDDENQIDTYAVGYIDQMYMAELISGREDNKFYPLEPLSRAEAAKMIYALYQLENSVESVGQAEEVADNVQI